MLAIKKLYILLYLLYIEKKDKEYYKKQQLYKNIIYIAELYIGEKKEHGLVYIKNVYF